MDSPNLMVIQMALVKLMESQSQIKCNEFEKGTDIGVGRLISVSNNVIKCNMRGPVCLDFCPVWPPSCLVPEKNHTKDFVSYKAN